MILVNNPGSWSAIYDPLEHAAWHGCTPTDLVFPFFLFAVGNAMSFVMPRLQAGGDAIFWKKVIRRTLLIFMIGLLLNWSPFFEWHNNHLIFRQWRDPFNPDNGIRILGVLQRIAICYFFASVIVYYTKQRGALYFSIVLLLGYWVLTAMLGKAGDPYSMTGYFGRDVDLAILHKQHMLHLDKVDGKVFHFDYEGITSTLAAIVQVIFGYLIGDYIQKKGKTQEMLNNLFVAGVVFIFAGFCWDMVFPINKKIWSSSYTVYTTGLALMVIAVMIHLIEFKQYKGFPTRFFDVFGKNPLFIFVLSGFLPRLQGLIRIPNGLNDKGVPVYMSPFKWFYENICKLMPGPEQNASLIYAIFMIIFYWAICYWLDKRKIYIKV
jgi:predicted acyltransferase